MSQEGSAQHYVCTLDDARELVERATEYWVSNCGCREEKGGCGRSRMDVCLQFRGGTAASGTRMRQVTRREVEAILVEARTKMLVSRPFRDPAAPGEAEGICFCCDCCCGYFHEADEKCDKGSSIEQTDLDACTGCGECVSACYFGAREVMEAEGLAVNADLCYGCGLCVDACEAGLIRMVPREGV
jgi:ferredoxin